MTINRERIMPMDHHKTERIACKHKTMRNQPHRFIFPVSPLPIEEGFCRIVSQLSAWLFFSNSLPNVVIIAAVLSSCICISSMCFAT